MEVNIFFANITIIFNTFISYAFYDWEKIQLLYDWEKMKLLYDWEKIQLVFLNDFIKTWMPAFNGIYGTEKIRKEHFI